MYFCAYRNKFNRWLFLERCCLYKKRNCCWQIQNRSKSPKTFWLMFYVIISSSARIQLLIITVNCFLFGKDSILYCCFFQWKIHRTLLFEDPDPVIEKSHSLLERKINPDKSQWWNIFLPSGLTLRPLPAWALYSVLCTLYFALCTV